MRTSALVIALLVCSAANAEVTPASAPPPHDEARAQVLFEEGTKHYDLGEWDAAIASFKQAYDLMPNALFLFDIAQSYRRAGRCGDARTFYRTYLRNSPTADNRDKVEKFLVELDDCVRREDDAVLATARASEPRLSRLHVAGIATAGAGVLLAIAGGAFSWRANDAASKIESQCANGCVATAVTALDERGRASATDAAILYSLAGTAIVAGAGMYLWAEAHPRETVTVTPTRGGAVVTAHVEF